MEIPGKVLSAHARFVDEDKTLIPDNRVNGILAGLSQERIVLNRRKVVGDGELGLNLAGLGHSVYYLADSPLGILGAVEIRASDGPPQLDRFRNDIWINATLDDAKGYDEGIPGISAAREH